MHWRNPLKLALSILLIALLFSLLLTFTRAAPPSPGLGASAPASPSDMAPEVWTKIEPLVLKELAEAAEGSSEGKVAEDGKTTYIVYLKEQADLGPAQLMAAKLARRQTVVSALQATAQRTQADIVAYLEQQKSAGKVANYTSYWIFNGLAVTGDLETLLALAARPEVEKIRANHKHQLPNPKLKIQNQTSNLQSPTSNFQPPTSNFQPPTSNIQYPTSNLQPPTSNQWCGTSPG